jgi:Spy/CpxP family protein refolding chaperone
MKAKTLMAVVLAGLTAGAMAQEQQAPPREGAQGGAPRRMMGAGGMPMDAEGMLMRALSPDSKLAKDIGMTEEQSAALKKLFADAQTETKDSRDKMEKLALEQADLLSQDSPDEAAVMKVVDQLGELRLQVAKQRIHQLLAAQKILTAEQRTQLREQMKTRLEQFREGRREGRGPREGGAREGGARRGPDQVPPPPAPDAPAKTE